MGFTLSSCQGCQAALCHPWGHWGQPRGCPSIFLLESKPRVATVLLGAGQTLHKQGPVAALWLLLAEPRQAPEAAQPQAAALWGCWGGTGGLALVSSISMPTVPGLARALQRGRVGPDPHPRDIPSSPHHPGCWHRAELGMGLSRGPGHPAWAAKSWDGWTVDAPGWCCSWPWGSGISDPALGSLDVGTACEILWVRTHLSAQSGCPRAARGAEGTTGLVSVPIPRCSSRAVAWKVVGVSQGREWSRAQSKYFQWFYGLWAVGKGCHSCLGDDGCISWLPRD